MTTLEERETALDEAALEAFADRMIVVLNDACTALMISIGHQTGLFGALHGTGPATSFWWQSFGTGMPDHPTRTAHSRLATNCCS